MLNQLTYETLCLPCTQKEPLRRRDPSSNVREKHYYIKSVPQIIILPLDNKFNPIAHLDDFFQSWDSIPRGASKRNVFWKPFHIEVIGVGLKFLVWYSLGFSAPQGLRCGEGEQVRRRRRSHRQGTPPGEVQTRRSNTQEPAWAVSLESGTQEAEAGGYGVPG